MHAAHKRRECKRENYKCVCTFQIWPSINFRLFAFTILIFALFITGRQSMLCLFLFTTQYTAMTHTFVPSAECELHFLAPIFSVLTQCAGTGDGINCPNKRNIQHSILSGFRTMVSVMRAAECIISHCLVFLRYVFNFSEFIIFRSMFLVCFSLPHSLA